MLFGTSICWTTFICVINRSPGPAVQALRYSIYLMVYLYSVYVYVYDNNFVALHSAPSCELRKFGGRLIFELGVQLEHCVLTSNCKTALPKSRYYKERNVQSKKRQAIRRWFVSIRHGRHVLSQCPKERHFPPVLVPFFNISGGWLPLFRALAKNMAPMTNADESPTNRLTLFPIYLSLFVVSTLWLYFIVIHLH